MDLHKEAYKTLDRIRMDHQKTKEQRQAQVYRALPQIETLDQEISKLGLNLVTAALEEQEPDMLAAMLQGLRIRIDELRADKQRLLTSQFPVDYLDLHHLCPLCLDTGQVHHKRCQCVEKLITDKYLEISGIQALLQHENFDTFQLDYYSDTTMITPNLSERRYMQTMLQHVQRFCHRFGQEADNLLFFGDPGRGKTFLCNCITKALTDAGVGVFYSTATRLAKTITTNQFDKDPQTKKMLDLYYTAPLLILDDLGTEFSTAVTNPELFAIINTRILDGKSTVISTNLDSKALEEIYSQRVTSRLFGIYKPFKVVGTDIRLAKRRKNM